MNKENRSINWQQILTENKALNSPDQGLIHSESTIFCSWLSHEDIIEFSGQDATRFLQGQFTCDVEALTSGQITIGACCNHQGRMIANFRLLKTEDKYLLTLPQKQGEHLINHLSRYSIFFRNMQIQLITGHWVRFGCWFNESNPHKESAINTLSTILAIDIPALPAHASLAPENRVAMLYLAESPELIKRFELWTTPEQTHQLCAVLSQNTQIDTVPHWQQLDIESGLAWITADIREKYIPQHLNLQLINGISWTKGCYTGQEIIARLHYRGKLKSHLYLMEISNIDQPITNYTVMYQNKKIGEIVNITEKDTNGTSKALVHLKKDNANEKITLFKNTEVTLQLQTLPYTIEV